MVEIIVAVLGIVGAILSYVFWRKRKVRTKVETAQDIEKSLDDFKQSVRKAIIENKDVDLDRLTDRLLDDLVALDRVRKANPKPTSGGENLKPQ